MWFIELSKENADIIHEVHPTQEVIADMKQLMFPNYRPGTVNEVASVNGTIGAN